MSPLAMASNGAFSGRPSLASSEQATKPFRSQLQRLRNTMTCLKLPAVKALAMAVLILLVALPHAALAAPPGTWSSSGDMGAPRTSHRATLLPNGKVLVASGHNDLGALITTEIYDPASGVWSPTGSLTIIRDDCTATMLPNGKVLVVGGYSWWMGPPYYLASAVLYDPDSGTWSPTGSMGTGRTGHKATLLPNGKVLVTGGRGSLSGSSPAPVLASAEIYNPDSGTWSPTGSLIFARGQHTATLLPNGKVLIAGGQNPDDNSFPEEAELYDSTSGTFSSTGNLSNPRSWHTATLLPNGKVMVAGGQNSAGADLDSVEIYDPATGNWSPANSLGTARSFHTANLLLNGKVLVAGGWNLSLYIPYLADGELYNPVTGNWSSSSDMVAGRAFHSATRLANGKVLVAGGTGKEGAPPVTVIRASAELYEPHPPPRVNLPPLLAFYPFEGNARDVSGNGRHGTITGFPLVVEGWEGTAYSFDGGSEYITAPLDINPDKFPKLTMGGWVRSFSDWPPAIQQIITHDNGGFDRSLGIDWRGGGTGWSAFCGSGGGVLGAVPNIFSKWTFVAVVYDQSGQSVRLQVEDMVLTKTGVALGQGQNQLLIGGNPVFGEMLEGAVDNVFVFGDALTDEQLAYIRSGGAQAIMTAARKANPGIFLLLMD